MMSQRGVQGMEGDLGSCAAGDGREGNKGMASGVAGRWWHYSFLRLFPPLAPFPDLTASSHTRVSTTPWPSDGAKNFHTGNTHEDEDSLLLLPPLHLLFSSFESINSTLGYRTEVTPLRRNYGISHRQYSRGSPSLSSSPWLFFPWDLQVPPF